MSHETLPEAVQPMPRGKLVRVTRRGGRIRLDGASRHVWRELQDALLRALPAYKDIAQTVQFSLPKPLNQITGETNVENAMFDLIGWVNSQALVEDLVLGARERAPGNPELLEFAHRYLQDFQLIAPPGATEAVDIELEKQLKRAGALMLGAQFLQRMDEYMRCVCLVDTPTDYGTGFLLKDDLVITNHHVVKDLLAAPEQLDKVVLLFDYRADAGANAVRQGQEYRLDTNRPIISSPFEYFDFALLPVRGRPGADPIGGQQGAAPRGVLMPSATARMQPDQPLFVIQHPAGKPLAIAIDIVLSVADTRLRYRTATDSGSSGSPCFNANLELVALHHASEKGPDPTFNQGIPFSAILRDAAVRQALGV